ncbi:WD40 repeat-like protein [Mycena metata]|uniref:WD40 repeat-like protein n=1 Tax=Mycena metata TaxID=1033252 RepID=A0AAD7IN98_9AGAR|nr:WD40 repeat-like protein [Mycena metata]
MSLLFANFNQDYSCVSVGTRKGYSITNCDPFGRVYTMNDGARGIVEMLFCTSLIALVGAPSSPSTSGSNSSSSPGGSASASPRKLQITNTKRQSTICELLFPSSILRVLLNRKTLVIVLETEIYVYDISNMRLLHVVETVPNPEAICALSPSADAPYLAYPAPLPSPGLGLSASSAANSTGSAAASSNATASSSTSPAGDLLLFSTRALAPANVVRAHRSPLAIVQMSSDGGVLATASVKGTVIRLFALPSLDKLHQFRRGATQTRIYSLAFNQAGTLLAAGSERGTVHLWKIAGEKGRGDKDKNGSSPPSSYHSGAHSPSESVDGHDGASGGGGYEAFVAGRNGKDGTVGTAIRRRSLHLTASLTRAASAYLPATLAEMWEPARDFAWLRLPGGASGGGSTNALGGAGAGERRCVVGLSSTTPHVMVISSDGYFYAYSIDLEKGGECVLVKQYSLLESGEDTGM